MNRTGLKILLVIVLLLAIILQATCIVNDKRDEKSIQRSRKYNESVEVVKIKYPPLGDYINKLISYGYFTISSIHIIDDYYVVNGNVVGDAKIIKDFFIYFNDVDGYRIKEYLVCPSEKGYQLDIVLELPR